MDLHVANVVHELRTPLAGVIAALELLRRGDLSPHETLELLEAAVAASHHLSFLTDDLLDDAALDAGKLRLQIRPLAAIHLMHQAQRLLTTSARVRAVILHVDPPARTLVVAADEHRFLQIVFNLVGNALKFAPPGSAVRMSAAANGDRIRFGVQDEGPGVPADRQSTLFEPFASCHDTDGGHRGTGLGLALCRRLVERMGGAIGHEPVDPQGARFWFELPGAVDGPLHGSDAAR